MAALINQSDRPLLVSDATPCEFLPFSHYLTSKVSLQLEPKCGLCTAGAALLEHPFRVPSIPGEFSPVFLYSSSKKIIGYTQQDA